MKNVNGCFLIILNSLKCKYVFVVLYIQTVPIINVINNNNKGKRSKCSAKNNHIFIYINIHFQFDISIDIIFSTKLTVVLI